MPSWFHRGSSVLKKSDVQKVGHSSEVMVGTKSRWRDQRALSQEASSLSMILYPSTYKTVCLVKCSPFSMVGQKVTETRTRQGHIRRGDAQLNITFSRYSPIPQFTKSTSINPPFRLFIMAVTRQALRFSSFSYSLPSHDLSPAPNILTLALAIP